jgi:hypothetical protein
MDGDQWRQRLADDLAIVAGLDLAVAVGARAAGLAGAAVVRPATATAKGVLRLGWRVLIGGGPDIPC